MRIGIDATALPPQPVGAGNYMIQLIRALVAAGTEQQLVIFAQAKGQGLIDLPPGSPVEWQIVDDSSPGRRFIWEQAVLPNLVRKAKIDLLHSLHYTKPWRLPCSSVVTFHDMTYYLYPEFHARSRRVIFPTAMRVSSRQADAILTVSESTRNDVIRLLNVDPEKIFTTQLGVDQKFRVILDADAKDRVASHYDLPAKFILYLGTIEPRKNIPQLIRSYASLVESGTEHQLVLAGKFGWMYEEVLDLVKQLDLEGRIQFTGYIAQEDIPLLFNLASLFVYPTVYEGFGLPVLEAMACGVPVITSDIASLPEIVGEAGLLIQPGDLNALSDAIKKVLGDPAYRDKLIREGLIRAKLFSWERTAQLTKQVYQHVLANSQQP
jgi:glycosyltransferase involved in cell wall biosynthesis